MKVHFIMSYGWRLHDRFSYLVRVEWETVPSYWGATDIGSDSAEDPEKWYNLLCRALDPLCSINNDCGDQQQI